MLSLNALVQDTKSHFTPVAVVLVVLGGVDHGAGFDADLLEQVPHLLVDVLLRRRRRKKGSRCKRECNCDKDIDKISSFFFFFLNGAGTCVRLHCSVVPGRARDARVHRSKPTHETGHERTHAALKVIEFEFDPVPSEFKAGG